MTPLPGTENIVRDPVALSTVECEALLRGSQVGVVAFTAPDGPHLTAVDYAVAGSSIVLRTLPHSMLSTWGRDTVVAFALQVVDHERRRTSHVAARGRASTLVEPPGVVAEEKRPARTWAPGQRSNLLEIRWTELTGRCVGPDLHP